MKRASVAELKAKLSEYLARAKAGEDVVITERGRAIARLVPIRGEAAASARMGELIRAGLVRAATGRLRADFWEKERPSDPEGHSLAAVLREREEGW